MDFLTSFQAHSVEVPADPVVWGLLLEVEVATLD